jgi:hypothetical protein
MWNTILAFYIAKYLPWRQKSAIYKTLLYRIVSTTGMSDHRVGSSWRTFQDLMNWRALCKHPFSFSCFFKQSSNTREDKYNRASLTQIVKESKKFSRHRKFELATEGWIAGKIWQGINLMNLCWVSEMVDPCMLVCTEVVLCLSCINLPVLYFPCAVGFPLKYSRNELAKERKATGCILIGSKVRF